MRNDKYQRMLSAFGNNKNYPSVVNAVFAKIPPNIIGKLTGKELGERMKAINDSFHEGKKSCGAEVVDGESVWIDKLNTMYDLSDIKTLTPSNQKPTM